MDIISENNPKIKELSKLNMAKYRKELKQFIVEGKHLVDEARKANLLIEAYSIEEKEGYIIISESAMKKICHTDTVVSEIGVCKLIDKKDYSNKMLLLDSIQDPGNLGSLMRSAKAFGFNTIVLGNGCCDIYNDKVIRSSQGAIFKLNFINANLTTFIPNLKDYIVYGTNVKKGISVSECEKNKKIALVLGNEGNGISSDVDSVIEKNIYIPLENTESLNVTVAGSILMYELK
ncbi:MAG: RNA methyltransferase [Acholeplasmatales bacterium]|nr:RNA methyltransferase [Acholeplasmatales bacterium]